MGCNCGKKAGTVARSAAVTGSAPVASSRMRSMVRFFVVPPPEDGSSDELVFNTLYEARAALVGLDGWRLESRRVPRS